MSAWANFGVRLALLPAFAVKALLQLPACIISEEPKLSAVPGARTSLATATPNGASAATLAATASGLPGTAAPLRVPLIIGKPEIQLVWRRLIDMRNASLLLLYQAFVYNVVVGFVKLLGAGVALTAAEPYLRRFFALFVGEYKLVYAEPGGQQEALYSVVNSFDTGFELPTDYAAGFPFAAAGGIAATAQQLARRKLGEAKRGHLGSMAVKLAYEEPPVIRDVVRRWGFTWLADQQATHGSTTVPETYWYAFHNQRAVVVCFRGTSPLNLINWQTDIDLGLSPRTGFPGKIHDGFYDALFDVALHEQFIDAASARVAAASSTVFGAALAALNQESVQGKAIYVCGHSLGGALASVFCVALGVHAPTAAARLRSGGILTYGQPRTGNAVYADAFNDSLGTATRRYVHAADIVPKVPAGLGYAHHDTKRFLPSFDIVSDNERVLDNQDEIGYWDRREATWALVYGFLKLLWSPVPPAESLLRTLSRVALLPLPGLSDHFPGDYETLMRENVAKAANAAAAVNAS